MELPIDNKPTDENHIPVSELEAWIAGDIKGHRAAEIAEHTSQCDMCADITEGLLEFDDESGLSRKRSKMYNDFREKNLQESRRKKPMNIFSGFNSMNTILLIIAALLLLTIFFSLFYLMKSPNKEETIDPNSTNRVDSILAHDPSMAYPPEDQGYIPDSQAVDSSIAHLLLSDPEVNYEYYDDDVHTPVYRPQHHEQIYVYNGPASEYITSYNSQKMRDDGHTTAQSRYYGYDSRDAITNTKKPSTSIQIGDQLLQIDKITSQAQSYYQQKEYDEGIYFLDRYASAVKEPVADLDYWLALMYAAKGELSYARYYLERIAGYTNPYQTRAKKMLRQN